MTQKIASAARTRATEPVSEADQPITWSRRLVLEERQLTPEDRARLIFDCPHELKRWWETTVIFVSKSGRYKSNGLATKIYNKILEYHSRGGETTDLDSKES